MATKKYELALIAGATGNTTPARRWCFNSNLGHSSDRTSIPTTVHHLDISGKIHRPSIIPDLYDLCDLYDLDHIAGWEANI